MRNRMINRSEDKPFYSNGQEVNKNMTSWAGSEVNMITCNFITFMVMQRCHSMHVTFFIHKCWRQMSCNNSLEYLKLHKQLKELVGVTA